MPPKRAKRRKMASEAEDYSASQDLLTAKGRAAAYRAAIRKRVVEEDEGLGAGERQMSRLMGEAMGRVGKSVWEQGRKSTGRLAAWRVPVSSAQLPA
jgi:hypothetical protein